MLKQLNDSYDTSSSAKLFALAICLITFFSFLGFLALQGKLASFMDQLQNFTKDVDPNQDLIAQNSQLLKDLAIQNAKLESVSGDLKEIKGSISSLNANRGFFPSPSYDNSGWGPWLAMVVLAGITLLGCYSLYSWTKIPKDFATSCENTKQVKLAMKEVLSQNKRSGDQVKAAGKQLDVAIQNQTELNETLGKMDTVLKKVVPKVNKVGSKLDTKVGKCSETVIKSTNSLGKTISENTSLLTKQVGNVLKTMEEAVIPINNKLTTISEKTLLVTNKFDSLAMSSDMKVITESLSKISIGMGLLYKIISNDPSVDVDPSMFFQELIDNNSSQLTVELSSDDELGESKVDELVGEGNVSGTVGMNRQPSSDARHAFLDRFGENQLDNDD